MSRSGYSEECENVELWRGAVWRAIMGKRGQAFLKEMLAAMDAMPVKRLIKDALVGDGDACAIGTVGLARGIDMSKLDPEDPDAIARVFQIAPAMVQEIEFMNDDDFCMQGRVTPEERFERVRGWILRQISLVQQDVL